LDFHSKALLIASIELHQITIDWLNKTTSMLKDVVGELQDEVKHIKKKLKGLEDELGKDG